MNIPDSDRKHYKLAIVVVCIAGLLGLYAWNSIGSEGGAEKFPIAWFIIVIAIVGSLVNEPFRKEEAGVTVKHGLVTYSLWKVSVAVVFAFLLYMLFISGLISGDFFPKFSNTELEDGGKYESMAAFMTQVKPATYKDVAKLLVWCFIAGYSEKFVPNLIARIVKSGSGADGK